MYGIIQSHETLSKQTFIGLIGLGENGSFLALKSVDNSINQVSQHIKTTLVEGADVSIHNLQVWGTHGDCTIYEVTGIATFPEQDMKGGE